MFSGSSLKIPMHGWERESFIFCDFDPKVPEPDGARSDSQMFTVMGTAATGGTVRFATIFV
jgi:hypothetical protein